MEEVLKMLKSGDTSLVKNRINTVPESSGKEHAEFYGFFYLGLFADAKGNQQGGSSMAAKISQGRSSSLHGRCGEGVCAVFDQ